MRLAFGILAAFLTPLAWAQEPCAQWSEGLGFPGHGFGGNPAQVFALSMYDAGNGPRVYAGGSFLEASGLPARRVAMWNGSRWEQAGAGLGGDNLSTTEGVNDFQVFDDGNGPRLYAAGLLQGTILGSVWRWDGMQWSVVPGSPTFTIYDLEVFDDGSGPALFAAGLNTTFNGGGVWRYDASGWTPISGLGTVLSLAVYDAGSGPRLYAGNNSGNALHRWELGAWVPVGNIVGSVFSLVTHDDGSGPRLFIGGGIFSAGGQPASHAMAYDGNTIDLLQGGMNSGVYALKSWGSQLYAAGNFSVAGGTNALGVARWNGSAWSAAGTGVVGLPRGLEVVDSGSGERLVAFGDLTAAGGAPALGIASFDGNAWSGFAPSTGVNGRVLAFEASLEGSGPELWVGGEFNGAGNTLAKNLARFDGTQWTDVGGANRAVRSFVYWNGDLYVGGSFTTIGGIAANAIARWDGSQWHPLGSGLLLSGNPPQTEVNALAVFDDGSGPRLYAGGSFNVAGGSLAFSMARWDGSQWSPIGDTNGRVRALRVHDAGQGPRLFAGGEFTGIGGVSAPYVASFDGASWSDLAGGMVGQAVGALMSYDNGSGSRLYAAGQFTQAGAVSVHNIAQWDGSQWNALAGAAFSSGPIHALTVLNTGSGAQLFAGGAFQSPSGRIASWNGVDWQALAQGVDQEVWALTSMATDRGPRDLYAGGSFRLAGEQASSGIARWEGCGGPGLLLCFGDAASSQACPCANTGADLHGCNNSAGTGGALLAASGSTALDTLVLSAQGLLPTALSIFLQGDALISPTSFGDGLRCAGGNLLRLYSRAASGGLVQAPVGSEPSLQQRAAQLGAAIPPGAARVYQVYYRDANPSFCPAPLGSTWNISSAVRVVW